MRIEIINVVPPVTVPTASGSYQKLEVAYKNAEGKVQGKSLVSFSNPTVFEVLSKAERGAFYEVTPTKEGKHWNWTAASLADGSAPVAPATYSASKPVVASSGRVVGSNYETSEERSWNRVRIGRQACLNTAVAALVAVAGPGGKIKSSDVLKTAEEFEVWVNRKDAGEAKREAVKAVENMKDDIPF